MFLFVFSCFSCGVPWCASISVDFQPLDPPGAQRGLEGPGGPGGLGTDGRLLPGSREAQLCHVVSHPWNLDQVRVGRCRWNTCAQSSPSCGHVFAASLVPSEAASASCRHHRGWHSANHGSASIRSSDEAPKHQAGSKWRDCWQVVFYRRDSVWQYPGHKHQQECGLGCYSHRHQSMRKTKETQTLLDGWRNPGEQQPKQEVLEKLRQWQCASGYPELQRDLCPPNSHLVTPRLLRQPECRGAGEGVGRWSMAAVWWSFHKCRNASSLHLPLWHQGLQVEAYQTPGVVLFLYFLYFPMGISRINHQKS